MILNLGSICGFSCRDIFGVRNILPKLGRMDTFGLCKARVRIRYPFSYDMFFDIVAQPIFD